MKKYVLWKICGVLKPRARTGNEMSVNPVLGTLVMQFLQFSK
jgi:hypothetical protein